MLKDFNLQPWRDLKRKQNHERRKQVLSSICLTLCAVMIGMHYWLKLQIQTTHTIIDQWQQRIAKYAKDTRSDHENMTSHQIARNQPVAAALLKHITQQSIKHLCLQEIKQQKQTIYLFGQTYQLLSLLRYVQHLRTFRDLNNLEITEIRQVGSLFHFKMKASLEFYDNKVL